MRILLIALLLAGCSTADIKGESGTSLEEQKGNARILHAEHECAGDGLVINTPAYDNCLYEQLKDEPELRAQLDRLKAEFAKRETSGITVADRQCEAFGYYRGTAEYNICLEYARENNIGSTGQIKVSN